MEISSLNTFLKDFKGKSIFLIQKNNLKNEEKLNVIKFDYNKNQVEINFLIKILKFNRVLTILIQYIIIIMMKLK
jgi:hypothetical protein